MLKSKKKTFRIKGSISELAISAKGYNITEKKNILLDDCLSDFFKGRKSSKKR